MIKQNHLGAVSATLRAWLTEFKNIWSNNSATSLGGYKE